MKQFARQTYDHLFPTPEELWERGGAKIADDVPYFELETLQKDPVEYSVKPLYVRDRFKRTRIGEKVLLGYNLSDGTDRLVSAHVLNDKYRSDADLLVTTSTAWTTTVKSKSYVGRQDEQIARELGLPTVSIGAEGSTNQQRLAPEVLAAVSLAKAAQSEQLILQDMSRRFDLPTTHYGRGDSRGGMVKPGHSIYAPMYGNEVLFTDIKAPSVPDKLEMEDMPRVGLWFAVEAMGGLAVAASLLKERDLCIATGTFDLHPRSLETAVTGIMPALMSGEAGRLAELAPNTMNGHVVLYGHDILSSVHRWHEIYADKPGMRKKDVPRGSHAHLLQRFDLQFGRIERMRDERLATPSGSYIDWDYVKTGIKKQADLRLVVND